MTAKQAIQELSNVVIPHLVESGCLPESNQTINDASRKVIEEYVLENFSPYLVNVNTRKPEDALIDARTVIWYNFCGCAIIPAYDRQLKEMILERLDKPYTGTKDDYPLVDAIFDRISEIGGTTLHWT